MINTLTQKPCNTPREIHELKPKKTERTDMSMLNERAYNTIITRAKAELAAAFRQSSPSDNSHIMDHVEQAYRLLKAAGPHYHVAGTTIGKDIDECALCGCDIRSDIHRMKKP